MKKITVKVSDDLAAEFNAAVKRRHTTQKKAFEIMLRDWLSPRASECGDFVARPIALEDLPNFEPSVTERILKWFR